MRVFLDTNVILDTLITGRPNSEVSTRLVGKVKSDEIRFSISSLSIADAAYSCRKEYSREGLINSIDIIRRKWRVLPFAEYNIYDAINSDCPDFEDAIQISIAEGDADVIVTNNVRHFKGYTALEVVTPQEFLDRVSAD
ncbi:MAG: PIN domain-containing protein [Bacteroidales bacterium]|nr:PIN domain-containing protein [Bacteroidales bacterium]